jgi:NADH-quinone oxidoreductase subunit F
MTGMLYNEPSPLEVKALTRRFGLADSASIDTYLATEGYTALRKALGLTPEQIIEEVKSSNLRGRGGAGFPTGMKWGFVPRTSPKPKYIVANGDESEPDTCKDRLLMEYDPHQLIESMLIAGLMVGRRGLRLHSRRFRYLIPIVDRAIEGARRSYWGSTSWEAASISTSTRTGAGATSVAKSALLESLEGKRGIPNPPAFPAVTRSVSSLNNIETLARFQ